MNEMKMGKKWMKETTGGNESQEEGAENKRDEKYDTVKGGRG